MWTTGSRPGSRTPVGPDTVVVAYDADPPETQPFYRAARRAGLAPRLFESGPLPSRAMAGTTPCRA